MFVVLAGSLGLVTYVFVGYPAIVGLLARLRPKPLHNDPGYEPRVSLVILAYNEEDVIEDRLRNVAELEYPRERLEVIVVADGSDDGTAARAARFPWVDVIHRPDREGKLRAINRGVAASSGDVLIFSDANNRYTPPTIRAIVAPFADPSVGMVTGRKSIDDGSGRALDQAEGLYWRYESVIKRWESAIGSVVGVSGEILATRRESYRSPDDGVMNEDFVQALLVAQDGWRVVYAPEARSIERASASIEDEMTRRARLTTGRFQAIRRLMPSLVRRNPRLAWQVVSHKGLRPLVPGALVAAALSNVALVSSRRRARLLGLMQLTFYLGALAGWRDERRGRRSRLTYLPFYFCKMNIATVRGLRDFARGHHVAVWARVDRG